MLLEEAIKHCEEKAKCGDSCGTEHKQLAEWLRELMQLRYNRAKAEACGRNGLLTLEDLVRSGYDPNDVEQAVRERDGLKEGENIGYDTEQMAFAGNDRDGYTLMDYKSARKILRSMLDSK